MTPGTRTTRANGSTHPPDPAATRDKSLAEIQTVYADKADWIHRFDAVDRLLTGRARRRQFGDAEGRVLDVACGTGTNVRYLPADVDFVGIDISDAMLSKAARTLDSLGRNGDLRRMDAQALEFPDDSFDVVVSALSTCTFPDPVAALREMARVCAPDGEIRLLEHGLSDVGPIARYQQWRAEAHYEKMGCRWTQQPTAVVEAADLPIREARSGPLGILTAITAEPGPLEG